MAAARLDAVLPEFREGLSVRWRAFSLEIINDRPASRHIVDQEWPLIAVQEPRSPCRAWPHEEFVRTTMMAYDAYLSANRQDSERARVYDLKIRRAFFYEGRRIDEACVLCALAEESGLDPAPILADVEGERYREETLADCREALRRRDDEGLPMTSPTMFLPSGEPFFNPFASEKRFESGKIVEVHPPSRYGEAVLEGYRDILRKAVA
jgi:predicted DsbA family dithiol-disulfide isomerase